MKCDNCGETEQATVDNGAAQQWCFDCMRLAGLCIGCQIPIRDVVDDYYNYEDDECPKCSGLGYTEPTLSDPDGLCSQCRGSGKRSPVS